MKLLAVTAGGQYGVRSQRPARGRLVSPVPGIMGDNSGAR
jgi:hypothetical protein